MGSKKSKPVQQKPTVSRITEQDRAILKLKQQRDKLKMYQKKIDNQQASLKSQAQELIKQGRKDRALTLLKKRKVQDKLYENASIQLSNIEKMTEDLEWAVIQVDIVKKLEAGNKCLKDLHKICSVEEVEKVMEETAETIAYQKEIDEAFGMNVVGDEDFDQDDLENELDALLGVNEVPELPKVPDNKLPEIVKNEEQQEEVEVQEKEAVMVPV